MPRRAAPTGAWCGRVLAPCGASGRHGLRRLKTHHLEAGRGLARSKRAGEAFGDEIVPAAAVAARSCPRSRRRRAGRGRASWRRRAAGCAPRARASSSAALAVRIGSSLLVPLTGHTNGSGMPSGRSRSASFIGRAALASPRSAALQVSGRNTIGASRPLAPCTVMTRTSLRPCSMSRLISRVASRMTGEEARERGRRAVVVGQREVQELVERVGGIGAEAREELRAHAVAIEEARRRTRRAA